MTKYKGKAINQPSGKAEEYSQWACNFYVGCSNGCTYCYCKKGILARAMGQDKPQLKKCFADEAHAYGIFHKELRVNLTELQKHGLFFSFTTDPMLLETKRLTISAVKLCNMYQVPVKVLTKKTAYAYLLGISHEIEIDRSLIAIGFTLTGHDELEPGASTNAERIHAMRILHDSGYKTFASIEPIVDFPSSRNMIEATLGFCDLYLVGLMSGKKYDVVEAQTFVEQLNSIAEMPKIYLKESLQKLTHYTNGELDINFVNSDYNIFQP